VHYIWVLNAKSATTRDETGRLASDLSAGRIRFDRYAARRPVATPPNAIVFVFGSGMLPFPKVAKAGILLNFVGIVVVSLVALYLAPRFL
jgi:hypothetical protein